MIMLNQKYRAAVILIGFVGIILALISRLFYLQVIQYDYFKTKSTDQLQRIIRTSPDRGYIYDRNKNTLAMTTYSYSVFASPKYIEDKVAFAKQVAPILDKSYDDIFSHIDNQLLFVWLARKKSKSVYAKLQSLQLKGIDFIKEERRVYPNKELAAQAIGFVGIDNQGLGGLEFQYNEFLTGIPGKLILESDPRGYRLITGQSKIVDPTYDGWHLYTTLDAYVQSISEKYLAQAVEEQSALKGNVIVMNPKTGEILAMANYPKFDANLWYQVPLENRKNRCVTDMYEPGSVFKMITLASALEEKKVSPDSIITIPETLSIGNRTIREAHGRPAGESSQKKVDEILIHSLNVGTTLLALKVGKEKFYQYITQFGIGEKTQVECPGESPGMIKPKSNCVDLDIAMMSFGQGIAVTPIQIAAVASVIANGGELLQPRIIQYLIDKRQVNMTAVPRKVKRRVISPDTAKKVTDMMVKVVDIGTAQGAQIHGYSIAGKTGTAQIPDGVHGYFRDRYVASFVGFLPAYDPQLLILVIVDSPRKSIWGATVAVPIFKNIAQDLVDYLDIPPDRASPTQNINTIKFDRP